MNDRYHQIESSARGGVRSNQFWTTDRKADPDDWRRRGPEGRPDHRGGSADHVRKKRLPGGVARLVGEKNYDAEHKIESSARGGVRSNQF